MSKTEELSKALKQSREAIKKKIGNGDTDDLYGLNQKRFQNEKMLREVDSSFISVRRYKVKPSKVVSIGSGSLILSIGLGIGLSIISFGIPLSSGNQFIDLILGDAGGISGLFYLISIIFLEVLFDPLGSLATMGMGWFIGGFVSAMVYKKEGKRGPVYSAYLTLSVTLSIAFITGIMLLNSGGGSQDPFFRDVENSIGSIMDEFIALLLIGIITTIISIPMIFVAWLGYKLGMYFATI